MKRIICIALAAMAMIAAGSSMSEARGGHGGHGHGGHGGHVRFGFFVGPTWGPAWGPAWGWPYSPYYPYNPYYAAPPVVIQQEPQTYIEKDTEEGGQVYWYFCKDPEGYYPYVKKCPSGWLKVLPDTTPEGEEDNR
jgi:hypothetical protein